MKKIRIILNGKGAANPEVRAAIHRIREEGQPLEARCTWEGGDAARFAQEALTDGIDVLVAGGGDGTINEVVNGLLKTDTSPKTALAGKGAWHALLTCHRIPRARRCTATDRCSTTQPAIRRPSRRSEARSKCCSTVSSMVSDIGVTPTGAGLRHLGPTVPCASDPRLAKPRLLDALLLMGGTFLPAGDSRPYVEDRAYCGPAQENHPLMGPDECRRAAGQVEDDHAEGKGKGSVSDD
jgi:hypothetical protein